MGYHQLKVKFNADTDADAKPLCIGHFASVRDLTRKATEGFVEQMTVLLIVSLFLCCFVAGTHGFEIDTGEQIPFEDQSLPYLNNGIEVQNRDMNEEFGDQAGWDSENKLQKRYGIGPHHRVSSFMSLT